MRKKNINFQEQFKNSQNFLHKLETIKKTSKDIKQKNKLTVHRNIWVKQYKYLSRLQRDVQLQLQMFLENFDKYFHYQYQEQGVFKNDDYKSYLQMKDQLQNGCEIFENKLIKQVQHLPLLVQKFQTIKNDELKAKDIQDFIDDIDLLLQNTQKQINTQIQQATNQQGNEQVITDQYDEGYNDIVYYLRPIADEVKGFDFKKERLKKIEEGQQHLIDYLLRFKDKLTGDQISEVIQEFNAANSLLHETLQLQIEKIGLDYQDALSFNHQVIRNTTNYQKFLHLYQIYIGRGKNLIQYFERLAIEFPKVSKANIQKINDYIVSKIYKERKIKAAKRNFLRQKEQLFYKVQKEVNLRIEKKIKDAQKQAETLLRKEQKLRLEKELEVLRAQYKERLEQKTKQQQLMQEQLKSQQKKKQSLRRLYLQDLGKRAEDVKQIKEQKKKASQLEQKRKKEIEQLQKKKKLSQIKPKVKERQSIETKKIYKKLEQKQMRQKFKVQNDERINKAIQSYPFRPQVEFSQERLNAPTQAMIKKKQTLYDKADKVQLTKMTGYNIKQLMGDMRFRLNTALQQAGLAQTEYARQLLTQMSRPNKQ